MGRAGAVMFSAGGLIVLVTLALPAWPHRHSGVLLGLAVLALVTALGLRLTEGRIPPLGYNPVTAAGSVVIAAVAYYGGSAGSVSIYACLYIWVVVYAYYFYPRPWALGQLIFAVATLGAVDLIGRHTWLGLGGWLTMTAALAVAAGVVSYLISDLRHAARSDGLTGLANRQCFEEALVGEMARTRRHPERHLTVALIDIDDFKLINDRHGHGQGDLLLREMSAAWVHQLRETDYLARFDQPDGASMLARFGGDEFAVLLTGCNDENAVTVMSRLQSIRPDVTISVGIALWDGKEAPEALMRRADVSLYAAKDGGRNRIVAGTTEAPPA